MPSAEVANMIPQMQHFFASQPVNRAYLFGSCSRGEETKDTDDMNANRNLAAQNDG